MFKRVALVALVVGTFLALAIPALAFNGMRRDYTVTSACAGCHTAGTFGAPVVYPEWQFTKHAVNHGFEADGIKDRAINGSVCQGCHSSNFNPAKALPTPTATTTAVAPAPAATNVAWGVDQSQVGTPQDTGNAPWSESFIGCSSCHYGAGPVSTLDGRDVNDTAHRAPFGEMANAQICGQCHSRYSYTVKTYSVTPIPYVKIDGAGSPIPNPSPTSLIQPQMALGYPMLGSPAPAPATGWNPAAPLSDYLNVPHPDWTPLPNPSATSAGFGRLQTYWNVDGVNTRWQQLTHEGNSGEYPEWANEGHANALKSLTSQAFWGFLPEATKQQCLKCHSADYRILKAAGNSPTSADVKYGVTCVGCHAPHKAGTVTGAWDEAFRPQLKGDSRDICATCHNSEIPNGATASPGADVHHPMKEMMDGYGAIDVSAFPSVHKGKCIQCHMAPTYWQRSGVQLGGNHTFTIIEPKDAVEASPVPVITAAATATASPSGEVTITNRVTWDSMPYSACSTCHNNNVNASPQPVATTTATPTPTAVPLVRVVTIKQMANGAQIFSPSTNTWSPGGDRALWLQDTIDQRREWTMAKVDQIHAELNAGAVRLGYADEKAARQALVAIPEADRTFGQTNFLKAYTNVQYVSSEGSFGLHNWDYSREIVNVALAQARAVMRETPAPRKWVVTMKATKSTMNVNQKVKFRGLVMDGWGLAGKGTLTIQRKLGKGAWKKWTTVKLATGGTYGKTLKMTKKGNWKVRGFMPGDGGLNLAANSMYVRVKVK